MSNVIDIQTGATRKNEIYVATCVLVQFKGDDTIRDFPNCTLRNDPQRPGYFEIIGPDLEGRPIVKRALFYEDYDHVQVIASYCKQKP